MATSDLIRVSPSKAKEILRKMILAHKPVLLQGAPGTGKTSIVQTVSEEEDADIFYEYPAMSDPTDAKGMGCVLPDGTADFIPFNNLKRYITAEKLTVVFLDDLGQGSPLVQASWMQAILARKICGQNISPHVTFIAATNRKQDKSGVSGILEAVKSRFHLILDLTPQVDANGDLVDSEWLESWVNWAHEHNMPTDLIYFVQFMPKHLFSFKPTHDIINSSNPRTIANCGDVYNLGFDESLNLTLFAGAAGEAFARDFDAFLSMKKHLVSPELIKVSPEKAEVPSDTSTLWAIVSALVTLVTEENNDWFFIYTARLPKEFSVLVVTDAIRYKPKLQKTKGYIAWAVENHEVITV